MKFISGIKVCEPISKNNSKVWKVKIPQYHRASIGYISNTTSVYYTYIKSKHGDEPHNFELILTNIASIDWHMVRRISITMEECVGAVYALSSALKSLSINVLFEEAITIETDNTHIITVIVNLKNYISNHVANHSTDDEINESIIQKLKVELASYITQQLETSVEFTSADFHVSKLDFLHSLSNTPNQRKNHKIQPIQYDKYAEQVIRIEDGFTCINQNLKKILRLEDTFYYTIVSDTEEKYAKILFLNKNNSYIYIDVHHTNEYGAISKYTEIIKKYHCNILASYSNQQISKDTAHWYALIDVAKCTRDIEGLNKLLTELEQAQFGDEDRGRTNNVFLIEANAFHIDQKVVMKFGQVKVDEDGDYTSIYNSKKIITTELMKSSKVRNTKNSLDKFIKENNLRHTSTERDFLIYVLKENNKKIRQIKFLGITVSIPLMISGIYLLLRGTSIDRIIENDITQKAIEVFNTFLVSSIVIFYINYINPWLRKRYKQDE